MKKRLRRNLLLVTALVVSAAHAHALTPTEWEHRQVVEVTAPGLTKVAIPAGTFDGAQPDLADLRLITEAGQEIPYYLDGEFATAARGGFERPKKARVASFQPSRVGDMTQLTIKTGSSEFLDTLELETSAPYFLKAAHVDLSTDGEKWESAGAAIPLFRQFGAEQLRIFLGRGRVGFVRITIDDSRSRAVSFSGGVIQLSPTRAAPPPRTAVATEITRREEFAGETVLTISLAGRQVPLAELKLELADALFMRRVTVSVREVTGGISGERVIGTGTIYRVALEGTPARTELSVPVFAAPPARELLLHIHNGDSPPLAVTSVSAQQHAIDALFMAPAAGRYVLLSGNPHASAPRYDLAVFAGEMRAANASVAKVGAVELTPEYHSREPLADTSLADVPLAGAPLDSKPWSARRPVTVTRIGVQELELDPEALAQSRADFADVRLLREGNQIAYILEQPALARSIALTPVVEPDPKRPSMTIWRLALPQAGLPVQRVVLSATTTLFQRNFRLYEKRSSNDGGAFEITLASGDWSRTPEPGHPATRVFEIGERSRTNTLWLETDNGDNPAITLGGVQAVYPVVRLVFKAGATDGLQLAYGNSRANAPRYDLSLVAVKLLTASRNPATLPKSTTADADATDGLFAGLRAGTLFWIVLGLVVVVLLVVVSRLLPKPPA
jgi:hypothetical protein